MIEYFKIAYEKAEKQRSWILVFFAFLFMNIFSLSTLTTKPALWYDEGINIELARNVSELAELDLILEPMKFSGQGALIGSTGYTTTIPLAGFFKLFGFGLTQARIYMLLWMNIFLLCLFYFARKKWGMNTALAIILLVTTFAPFYGNGRSVMGEIPGFTFLLFTLVWYAYKKNLFATGLFLGLAVISKPSVYVFLIPAFLSLLLFEKKDFFARAIKLGIGAITPFLIWVAVYADTALSPSTWQSLRTHFNNPYEQEKLTSFINIKNNLAAFFDSSTLIYFLLLTIVIISAIYVKKDYYENNKQIIILAATYGILEFFYFLKSLGYLRYLIAVQLLIFILLIPALRTLIPRFISSQYSRLAIRVCVGVLVLFQMVHLFVGAQLFYSNNSQKTFQYLEDNFKGQIIGIINVPTVASLVSPLQRMQTISTYGLDIGENPLSFKLNALPNVIIFEKNQTLAQKYKDVLNQNYLLNKEIGNILIYEKH